MSNSEVNTDDSIQELEELLYGILSKPLAEVANKDGLENAKNELTVEINNIRGDIERVQNGISSLLKQDDFVEKLEEAIEPLVEKSVATLNKVNIASQLAQQQQADLDCKVIALGESSNNLGTMLADLTSDQTERLQNFDAKLVGIESEVKSQHKELVGVFEMNTFNTSTKLDDVSGKIERAIVTVRTDVSDLAQQQQDGLHVVGAQLGEIPLKIKAELESKLNSLEESSDNLGAMLADLTSNQAERLQKIDSKLLGLESEVKYRHQELVSALETNALGTSEKLGVVSGKIEQTITAVRTDVADMAQQQQEKWGHIDIQLSEIPQKIRDALDGRLDSLSGSNEALKVVLKEMDCLQKQIGLRTKIIFGIVICNLLGLVGLAVMILTR